MSASAPVPPHKGAVDGLVQQLNASVQFEASIISRNLAKLNERDVALRDARLLLIKERESLERAKQQLVKDRTEFENGVNSKWGDLLDDDGRRVRINVGGQIFETTRKVLCRDRFSLLGALCREHAAIEPDMDGVFFIDRDWWLFRHILAFLRDGTLPSDIGLLQELYIESAFYRLATLRFAIEQRLNKKPKPPKSATKAAQRDLLLQQAASIATANAENPAASAYLRAADTVVAARIERQIGRNPYDSRYAITASPIDAWAPVTMAKPAGLAAAPAPAAAKPAVSKGNEPLPDPFGFSLRGADGRIGDLMFA